MHVLEVKNLIRNYQKSAQKKSGEDIKVLKGLNFAVDEGEFVGIMGKSGCGKTTLLKVLGMIDKQTDVINALNRINREFGKTIVMVTHDPQMASNCSRIILLKDGVILDNLERGEDQEKFYQEIIGRMADL